MIPRHHSDTHSRKMTKSELVEALSLKQTHLMQRDVDSSVGIILEAITRALCHGERIEIRGFGSFALSHRPARIGRNPKTGEAVPIKATTFPRFRPGKDMRLRVQASGSDAADAAAA
jgi:integration host factor subunit beta